ncbi:MAG: serine/threonine protein kinase [Kiritimatiellia bacterium]|jgi:serine/threonine protein kinase
MLNDEDDEDLFDFETSLTCSTVGLNLKPLSFKSGDLFHGQRPYRLIRMLGAGAMGSVYLADVEDLFEEGLSERCAIKLFFPWEIARQQDGLREIRHMRALKHPNILPVLESGSVDGVEYAVVPFCSQGSLEGKVRNERRLEEMAVLQVLEHILMALVESHSRGVLHLDIKPANILLDAEGTYLLSDFGVAHSLFQHGKPVVAGTPVFMSPEQARGDIASLDGRSDLFSLGAVASFLLEGGVHLPGSLEEILDERIRTGYPVGVFRDGLGRLRTFIEYLTAYDPHRRPGSAAEALCLVRELQDPDAILRLPVLVSAKGTPIPLAWKERLRTLLSDPVTLALLREKDSFYQILLFEDDDLMCVEEELSYEVYVLLHGAVDVIRNGRLLGQEAVEGTVLGEVSALTGQPRTATLSAVGTTVVAVMQPAELEQSARRIPALAMRIMKSLALRVLQRDQVFDEEFDSESE